MSVWELVTNVIIPVVIIVIISGISLWLGVIKRKRLISLLGIVLIICIVFVLFFLSLEFRGLVTALAAVSIAIIAAINIIETRRLKRDIIEREERDRKVQILKEIIEWAQSAHTLVLGYPTGSIEYVHNVFGSLQTIRVRQVSLAKLVEESLNEDLAMRINNIRPLLDDFTKCVENELRLGGQKTKLPHGIDSALIKLIEDASMEQASLQS